MRYLLLLVAASLPFTSSCQDTYSRMPDADVLHYSYELTLSDESNKISGIAGIQAAFGDASGSFYVDLIGVHGEFGMTVEKVLVDNDPVDYTFQENRVQLPVTSDTVVYEIHYSGVPERGLVIDKTKFGDRSFFGDNWPNLGRHWLPGVDHPYDKASVEFIINAPAHYDVVATGAKVEESYLSMDMKRTHYFEPSPVAIKVMTIGVTRFASRLLGNSYGVPVSAWVYPQNREDGFYDYAMAIPVMDYFTENIGSYPFAKLANMQAKTQWGGLENAGTIAYNENSVDGKRSATELIAHEIAHQWFGNSATEADWNHVWLSEGFATYFSILFLEHLEGEERRKKESAIDRNQIVAFYKKNPSPIVDPSIKDPMKVLNTNSYQKGGWVLHMLRNQLGDEVFWQAIRRYYQQYQHSNALTDDLRKVFEEVSGKDLEGYFRQWVFTAGFPELDIAIKTKGDGSVITVVQTQDAPFNFPLEIGVKTPGGELDIYSFDVSEKKSSFTIENTAGKEIIVDPDVNLLYSVVE